ncbi:MAG: NADH:flavin oxidoreductase/NADH oxidase family protein [Amphritea sp.]|nr:NADH:flavin oxidoreductase/NADH oxidase family protein [Amphritea sp.]
MTKATEKPLLNHSLTLPCGAVLKNRFVKSAMSDSLGDGQGNPTDAQTRLYERWAEGGTALSIIGEVQIDARFPEKPGNLVLSERSDMNALRQLTSRATVNQAHIWPQLGHAGALSHPPLSQPAGPSALNIGELRCDGLSLEQVRQLPDSYARAALIAQQAGFTGVQIHAGHGFLLSQFLSPLFNKRTDLYGGSIEARSRIIVEVIESIRKAVGTGFPIGIKINCSDLLEGGLTESDALDVIRILNDTTLDLIEISGGTYFPGAKASSDRASDGPYYLGFAQMARQLTDIPIMITGGFKHRDQAIAALYSGAVDLIGLARAMVVNPNLPNDWISNTHQSPAFPRFESTTSGGITAWFTMRLTALEQDNEINFDMDLATALDQYEMRDNQRVLKWREYFSQ